MHAGLGADHMCADLAVGQFLDAELAVFEERPQPIGLEGVGAEMVDDADLARLVLGRFLGGREKVGHRNLLFGRKISP
jgi:hypothetical protein